MTTETLQDGTIVTTENGIRTETKKSPISLDRIYKADYQKEGTMTAQIRQNVESKSFYPSKKIDSSMNANIFGIEEFGFASKDYSSNEARVAWIPVPMNSTEAEVKAKLEAAVKGGATIYRVLSNHPILDENQKYAIANPDLDATTDTFANSQAVRFPEGHEKAGQLILDNNGKVQYRRTFFWLTPLEDVDARTSVPADQYVSPEIAAELSGASVMAGQTI